MLQISIQYDHTSFFPTTPAGFYKLSPLMVYKAVSHRADSRSVGEMALIDALCALWAKGAQGSRLLEDVLITCGSVCRINLSMCSETKGQGHTCVWGVVITP